MESFVIGLNFRTACVEELELATIPDSELVTSLRDIMGSGFLSEAVLLSTCNRVEVYGVTDQVKESAAFVEAFFRQKLGMPKQQVRSLLYQYWGQEAVKHLFKVASSIDSMIVGEPQILGQVKRAYETAVSCNYTGKILNHVFRKSFKIAKKSRSETDLSRNPISIATVTINLGQKIFSSLEHISAILIGAGEIAEQIGVLLAKRNPKNIYILNRTQSRAVSLAKRLGAIAISEINPAITEVDIVISSTSSHDFMLTKDQIRRVMRSRRKKPLFLIDVSVPRDIDPGAQGIENVYLFNIDDLGKIAEENRQQREQAAKRALELIDNEVSGFTSWLKSLKVEPVIATLKKKIETLCEDEISRCVRKNRTVRLEREVAKALAQSLSKKILHDPISVLKESAETQEDSCAEAARRLFRLG